MTHAYSYEHMELAAYAMLRRIAERAQDAETAELARRILTEERAMAERLSLLFERAVDASLRDQNPNDLGEQLNSYLTDAHAIEAQAIELLSNGADIAGQDDLSAAFGEHLQETHEHQRLIDKRLTKRARRVVLEDQGRRAAPRGSELGRVLQRPAGHPREARRVRLRV